MSECHEKDAHRDLVSRLGFGDNITEPMADNDTIVRWFEEQSRDASEWQESQLWRLDCYEKGHSELEDCFECDPALRLMAAEAKVARIEALLNDWDDDSLGRHVHWSAVPRIRAAIRGDDA